MRVRLTLAGMSDAAWVSHPKGDHVVIPLDGPLDEAAVEEAARALATANNQALHECGAGLRRAFISDARAAIAAYLRAVGGGE